MITITDGNLLKSDADALVNTVNCAGHMGKGIALQFKKAFPENYAAYRRACDAGEVEPGRMFVHETGAIFGPQFVINFPTKRHWRGKSRYEDIEQGLEALVDVIRRYHIRSVALPPLGCGLGGLKWDRVREMIETRFSTMEDVDVRLYAPNGTPAPGDMPVNTNRPNLTTSRALYILVMAQYARLAYRLSLLEVQKLAYFLQASGEPLRLNYEAGHYGPYAHNLNKVLEVLEGHYIRGYGDTQKPDVEIDLLPGAVEEAESFLRDYAEERDRLESVASVIEGFETPYGMELLSSVHWVSTQGESPAATANEAIAQVWQWNTRKRDLLREPHLYAAWDRLLQAGWIGPHPTT